jgi:hypothetical protein
LQLVFRKLADVQREKELANRDKDDAPLDASTDLAVRRLISRFRKAGGDQLQRRTTSTSSLRASSAMNNNNDTSVPPDDVTAPGTPAPPPPTVVTVQPIANGSVDGPTPASVPQKTTGSAASKFAKLLLRSATAATANGSPGQLPPPAHAIVPIASPSPTVATKQKSFVWPKSSAADRQQQQQPLAAATSAGGEAEGSRHQQQHSSVRCHCDGSADSKSMDLRFEIDRLNERMDQIDRNVANILRLLSKDASDQSTTGARGDSDGRRPSVPSTAISTAVEVDSSVGAIDLHPHQHQATSRVAAGDARRMSQPRPVPSPSPLLMDTISELDEDSSAPQSLSDVQLIGASFPPPSSASTDDVRSQRTSSISAGDRDGSKRLQIQHDLEIM